jgi:hypothetical protein
LPERGKDYHGKITLSHKEARDGAEVRYSFKKRDRSRNLVVKIPLRIRNGQQIRLRGMGSPGKAGGDPGDLYLRVQIRRSITQRLKDL